MIISSPFSLYHANGSTAGYDNLNQLTGFARGTLTDTNSDGIPDTISTSSQSQSWTTDGQGNFTSITTNGTAQTRTYDQQNELTGVGSTTLTYDAAGDIKTDDQNRTYVYDGWGQLISVSVPGNSSSIQASYTYDSLGHRITETSGGVTRDIYYSANWQVIEERVSNVVQTQYVWSPVYVDQMIERDRNADGNTSTGTNGLEERLYVQTDSNFNVTALIDTSGNVVERYVYDPYGKVTILSPDGSTVRTSSSYAWQYLHQGGRQDTATGLLNFRNRDYSTNLMRWTTNDPIGFGGGDTNTYRYVGNGPGNGLDPSGLQDSNLEKKGEKSLKEPTPQLDRDRKGERTNQQKNETEFTEESARRVLQDKINSWESKGFFLPAEILKAFLEKDRDPKKVFCFNDLTFNARNNLYNWFKDHLNEEVKRSSFSYSDKVINKYIDIIFGVYYRWYSEDFAMGGVQRTFIFFNPNRWHERAMGFNEMMFVAFGGAEVRFYNYRSDNSTVRVDVNVSDWYKFPYELGRNFWEPYRAAMYLQSLKNSDGTDKYPNLRVEFIFTISISNPRIKK